MSSLFVLLPLEPASGPREFPHLLTPDGRTVAAHATASAALLPAVRGAGAEVVAVVPVQALSWHRVELPKGVPLASPRLRAVLEGLLEDQLLDEPEALHFALQPQARAGSPVWVATCDRAWLRAALQALEQAGRPATRIVPELAPETPTRWQVLGSDADTALAVAAGADGVTLVPLQAGTAGLLPPLPEDGLCLAEPAVAALAEQLLGRQAVLQPAPQRWLQAGQSGWDLAQLEFASSGRALRIKQLSSLLADLLRAPQWRPARWAMVLLLAANLVGLNAWAWKERSALQAKRDAVRTTLTQTFPQVRVVVDAPVQMEREVAALRQAAGATSGRDLETLLGALAAAAPGRSASGLEYTGTELRVRGTALGPEELRASEPQLRSLGVNAALQGDTLVLTAEAAP